MSDSLIKRAADLNETIEFSLGGWRQALLLGFFGWAAFSVVYPSNLVILFHWWWLSVFWAIAFLAVILRHSRWSPFFVGPSIRMDRDGISGRGGWGHKKWLLAWSKVDRVDWGRNGIFIYRKGMNNWELPYRQVGPFNVSGSTLVRCINERLNAYTAHLSGHRDG